MEFDIGCFFGGVTLIRDGLKVVEGVWEVGKQIWSKDERILKASDFACLLRWFLR